MEPICLFPVSGIILRTCFRLFADSDVAFVFLADKLARFCHHIGKALPKAWQNFANMVAKRWQSNLLACCVLARIVQRYHHKGEEILGRFCRRIHYFVNFHSSNKNFPFPNVCHVSVSKVKVDRSGPSGLSMCISMEPFPFIFICMA